MLVGEVPFQSSVCQQHKAIECKSGHSSQIEDSFPLCSKALHSAKYISQLEYSILIHHPSRTWNFQIEYTV